MVNDGFRRLLTERRTSEEGAAGEGAMGWEALFADLEGEFEAAQADELAAEVEDRSRREAARLRLVDRLRPAQGRSLAVTVVHLGVLRGRVAVVGPDWFLLVTAQAREVLVPTAAVLSVAGLANEVAEPGLEGQVAARLGLGYALRALARDRAVVSLTLSDGGSRLGTIDQVGADFVVFAEHPAGEARRAGAVREVAVVPFSALLAICSV
jgi:hypothetical protein